MRAPNRVVVTGSECTGKTTLAQALAGELGTSWVPEYARQFVAEKGAPPEAADVETIARGHLELEDRAAAELVERAPGADFLLVLDTDLLSTIVYGRHYYGASVRWIETELARRRGVLYLLAGIDVPWVPDGHMRDRPDRREEMHELFRSALEARGLPHLEIRGTHEERLRRALEAALAVRAELA